VCGACNDLKADIDVDEAALRLWLWNMKGEYYEPF
jgi:hypothetical protein